MLSTMRKKLIAGLYEVAALVGFVVAVVYFAACWIMD